MQGEQDPNYTHITWMNFMDYFRKYKRFDYAKFADETFIEE